MPVYEYEAKLMNGTVKKGKMEAVDEFAVRNSIRSSNMFPVKVKAEGKSNIDFSMLQSVTLKDISIFCRQFSYILIAGMPMLRAIDVIQNQTENKKLKSCLAEVYEDVQKGKDLSSSMKKHSTFPDMLINMVAVGEASGTLDTIMNRVSEYYEREYEIQRKVKQALTYPVLIAVFAFIIVNFLVIFVLPQMLGSMMSDVKVLPLPTRVVIGLSKFMGKYWPYILVAIVTTVIMIRMRTKSTKSLKLDQLKLKLPVFGKINLKVVTSKFARTFGMLLGSGLPIIQSIEVSASVVGNHYIEALLLNSIEDLKKGRSLGDSLEEKKLFPPMLTQMIKIGEETGNLDDVLGKTAEFYDGEVQAATSQMTTMIEPLVIIVLAVVVGFIILAIILPMFQMYDNMG